MIQESSGLNTQWYSMPTLSLVQKWLREEKGLHIDIAYHQGVETYDCYLVESEAFITNESNGKFDYLTYEEALSVGINECIKQLTEKHVNFN